MIKKFLLIVVCFVSVFALSVKDSLGRVVNVSDNVKRVIAIGPGALRLVVYMQGGDKVVGIEKKEKSPFYSKKPYMLTHPNLLKLPVIGMGGPNPNPDLEKIIALKPDVIFAGYINASQADNIQNKTDIPVVVLSYGKIGTFANDKLFYSLNLIGKIIHNEKRAEKLKEFLIKTDKDLRKRASKTDKKIYIGAVAFKGIHGITSTMPKFPPFKLIGIQNVINANAKSQVFISKEALYKANPDIIFLDESGLKIVKKEMSNFKNLKAVKNNEVYGILPYNLYMTNIATAYADTYYVGKVVFPDKFKDVNPVKKADELYKFLLGKACYKQMAKFFGGFKKLEMNEK